MSLRDGGGDNVVDLGDDVAEAGGFRVELGVYSLGVVVEGLNPSMVAHRSMTRLLTFART